MTDRENAVKSNQLKAIANVGRPACSMRVLMVLRFLLGGRHRHANRHTPRPIFDRPGGDYQRFAGAVRRSGGLCLGVRAGPALPGLELQLSER